MLTAICGTCKGKHETIAEYRDCQGVAQPTEAEIMDNLTGTKGTANPASDKQVKYAMDLLSERNWPDEFSEEDLKSMERRQVSELIDSLRKAPRKKDHKVGANGVKQEFKDIPDGRYALEFKDDVWKFFQVNHGHTRLFLNLLIGSPGSYRKQPLYGVAAEKILKEIRRVTPRQASINYGLKSETCGVCGSDLSNDESLKLGIGPKCRAKLGW